MYKKISTSLIVGALALPAFAGLEVDTVTHLKFEAEGPVIGRSETSGYILKNKANWTSSFSGFSLIDPNATFSFDEKKANVVSQGITTLEFFQNYPSLPDDINAFLAIGLTPDTTDTEFKEIADYHLSQAEALLKGSNKILDVNSDYQGAGIAGDYLLLATGESTEVDFLRCKISDWNGQSFETYKDTCDFFDANYTRPPFGDIDALRHQPINSTGYVLVADDSNDVDENNEAVPMVSIMYPNGDIFNQKVTLPNSGNTLNSYPVHITTEPQPYLYIGQLRYKLTASGPIADSIQGVSRNSQFRIPHSNTSHYYISTAEFIAPTSPEESGKIETHIFVCEKSIEVPLTNKELLELLAPISEDMSDEDRAIAETSLKAFKNYPELPDIEDRAEVSALFGEDYNESSTKEEFNALLDQEAERLREALAEGDADLKPELPIDINNPDIPCKNETITHRKEISRNPIIAQTPNKYISNNNQYLRGVSAGSFITKIGGDGSIINDIHASSFAIHNIGTDDYIIDIEEAAFSLLNKQPHNLSLSIITTAQSSSVEGSTIFDNFPEVSTLSKSLAIAKGASDEEADIIVRYYRAYHLLKAMDVSLSTQAALPQLGTDGNYLLSSTGDLENAWIINTKITSPQESDVQLSIVNNKTVIDPYTDATSQFSLDVTGEAVFALDVHCNIASDSLQITDSTYNNLFGSQNSMTLPMVFQSDNFVATETLVAPSTPFSGTGSFSLTDLIADFTTEDVDVVCGAEISDINGNLLNVGLTTATISIDDGVHGGQASVSGSIDIPGLDDKSGVSVTLTIDGRQVVVVTDTDGNFSFEGLRDGDFTISMESENYVQSCQQTNISDGNSVDLGTIKMLAGDINADGTINIADFTYLAARYRAKTGDADYDIKADLNKDGIINIQDLAILGSHFGSTQCAINAG